LPIQFYYLEITLDEILHDFSRDVVYLERTSELFGNDMQLFDQLFIATTFRYNLKNDGPLVSF